RAPDPATTPLRRVGVGFHPTHPFRSPDPTANTTTLIKPSSGEGRGQVSSKRVQTNRNIRKRATPSSDPKVPGARGMSPAPAPVATASARRSPAETVARAVEGFWSTCSTGDYAADQIVVVSFGYLYGHKVARLNFESVGDVVYQDGSVDLRRLSFHSAFEQEIGLL